MDLFNCCLDVVNYFFLLVFTTEYSNKNKCISRAITSTLKSRERGNYTTHLSDARVVSNKKIIREKIIPQLNTL